MHILYVRLKHQASSINAALPLCEKLRVRVPSVQCSREKLSVFENPLAYCHVETRMKLKELILAEMVDYGLFRVQFPLWL